MKKFIQENSLYLAWAASLVAVLGSLYFSNIADFTPCVLCWYQRIAVYPLVIILGFSIYKKNREMVLPSLALAVLGWLVALYHNLIYYEIIPEAAAPCVSGVSCSTKFVQLFGFMDIPLMSLLGFSGIVVLLMIYWKTSSKEQGAS